MIKNKILDDVKEAMKSGDKEKRDALRVLSSALKQIEIDERRELSDEDVISILKKAYKQREDAATQYKNANREDLFAKESYEMGLILAYLPKQLSDDELICALQEIIKEIGATSQKDMGKVMGVATKKLGAVADGGRISTKVKELLK